MKAAKGWSISLSFVLICMMPLISSGALAWSGFVSGNTTVMRVEVASTLTLLCGSWIPVQYNNSQCLRTTNEFMRIIDLGPVAIESASNTPVQFPVVFRHKLLAKLNSSKISAFLAAIIDDYTFSQITRKSTWDIANTIRTFFSSEFEQTEVLATLFQDTSSVAAHIFWLSEWRQQNDPTSLQSANIDLLIKVFNCIRENRDSSEPLKIVLGSYHQYVPRFIAERMKAEGLSAEYILSYAYGLNYLYETLQATKEINLGSFIQKSLSREVIENTDLRDVYNAYVGVFLALHMRDKMMDYSSFVVKFKKDPRSFHRSVIDSLHFDAVSNH